MQLNRARRSRRIVSPLLLMLLVWMTRGSRADVAAAAAGPPETVSWDSATTGSTLVGHVLLPPHAAAGPVPTVVYLTNLSVPRLGTEPDGPILSDLAKDGYLVLTLDYQHSPKAVSPLLNADMLKLRQDASAKAHRLLDGHPVDLNHLYILIEGFRLKRDVEFCRDGPRVLAMDVQYPSRPAHPVPALLEYTCDNVNRMGTGSLLFCHDTLLDGGMAAGFAVAMADHPVKPPYKGMDDPMPQVIERAKAAIRVLRSLSAELDLNGNIGAIGFSRGGPIAAMVAVTPDRPDLDKLGAAQGISSRVQAALIHGNRYDYVQLDPHDPMYKRFAKVWGPPDTAATHWQEHGAAFYLPKDGANVAPMFLDTSDAESKEYRGGLLQFDAELTAAHVEHHYQIETDGRGHRVSTDPKVLGAIYAFFQDHLRTGSTPAATEPTQ